MNLVDIVVYTFSGTVCLVMAIVLLFVKTKTNCSDLAYEKIKQNLAFSALIDVVIDLFIIYSFANGINSVQTLSLFFIPLAYTVQLALMTSAILDLIHSAKKLKFITKSFFIFLAVLTLLYCGGFIIVADSYDIFFSKDYLVYHESLWGRVFSTLLQVSVIAELVYCVYLLITENLHYIRRLNNYFSGDEVLNGRHLNYISYCFLGYFILAAIDFTISGFDMLFMVVNTLIFLSFVLFVFKLSDVYSVTNKMNSFQNIECNKMTENLGCSDDIQTDFEEDVCSDIGLVNDIRKWERRSDKPYLRDGILIADVAKDMGIMDMQLSFVLNHSLNINFNSWINKLRVEESKRLLLSYPDKTVSEITYAAGFSDINVFSRNFKKITGMTPTAYKKQVQMRVS